MNKIFLLTVTALLSVGFSSMAFANDCEFNIGVNCPPSDDTQSFIDGRNVQLNGGYGVVSGTCPLAAYFNWDWGDSTSNNSFFPAAHTYSAPGNYTVTVTAFDDGGNAQISDSSCIVSIPCETDAECDDGLFCTGSETCNSGTCGAVSACPPSIDGCVYRNDSCDEDNDVCVNFLDDSACAEEEICAPNGDCLLVGAIDIKFCSDPNAFNCKKKGGPAGDNLWNGHV